MHQSRGHRVHRITLNHDLSDASEDSLGDTWTHRASDLHRTDVISGKRGLVVRSWGDTWTHQKLPIFIGREKLRGNMDHVVGHDSIDFARSDGSNLIVKQTVYISRGIFPLKTDVFSSFT